MILVSRGALGAVLVSSQGSWSARCRQKKPIHSTVGCGDALLAGFLAGLGRGRSRRTALSTAIKTATAHAWDLPRHMTWKKAQRHIQVDMVRI